MAFIPDEQPKSRFVPDAPEKGNMYTQGAEEIVYSPEGIPLYTSSYGAAPKGATEGARKALTTAVSLPLSAATGAAKPIAGGYQFLANMLRGGEGDQTQKQISAGDLPLEMINQIEGGIQKQSGDIGGVMNKGASIAGEIAPLVMSGQAGTRMATDLTGKVMNALPKMDVLPSYAAKILRGVTGGGVVGATSGVLSPEETGLSPEEYRDRKASNVAMQASVGGAIPLVPELVKLAGKTAGKVSGMMTGAGGESMETAYEAGKKGGTSFWDNLSGDVSAAEVLDQAKRALSNMRATRKDQYVADIASTKNNPIYYKFDPIKDKMADELDTLVVKGVGGVQSNLVGKAEMKPINEMKAVIKEWEKKPELWTAEGLDALKRRLDAIYPEKLPQAQRVITGVRDKVYDHIVSLDPKYAKTMKNYEEALKVEREIEKALSLGGKAAEETAIRKLQSLSRNNANTSFAYRKELANKLKTQGGEDIMPAVAGQALSEWMPRGLGAQTLAGLLGGGAAYTENYDALPYLALASPKLAGMAAYGAGKAGGVASKAASKTNAQQRNMAKILLMKTMANNPKEEE